MTVSSGDRLYVSKIDMVTDLLRELITQGELPPGAILRQRELAERFGVSPTPVREALCRLEVEGLVDYDLHRGSTVAATGVEEAEENYRILSVLESLAISLSFEKLTGRDLEEIRELRDELAAVREGDPHIRERNRLFHFRIYECAQSPLLLALMRLLWRSFPRGSQAWRPHEESVRQHAELVRALETRDGALAASITKDHVLGSIHHMREKVAEGVSSPRKERTRRCPARRRTSGGLLIHHATSLPPLTASS